jgi:hypothetical protein
MIQFSICQVLFFKLISIVFFQKLSQLFFFFFFLVPADNVVENPPTLTNYTHTLNVTLVPNSLNSVAPYTGYSIFSASTTMQTYLGNSLLLC